MNSRRSCLCSIGLVGIFGAGTFDAPPRRNATFNVEVTAYCDAGETASGARTRRGIVAADPRVLPLGTRIRVQGLGKAFDGIYDVEDTGREVKGRELDIFMRDCRQAKVFGRKHARIRVLRVGTGERVNQRAGLPSRLLPSLSVIVSWQALLETRSAVVCVRSDNLGPFSQALEPRGPGPA